MPPDHENNNHVCTASSRDDIKCFIENKLVLTVVVLGASGDLAKKKTFPALFTLFKRGYATFLMAGHALMGKQIGRTRQFLHVSPVGMWSIRSKKIALRTLSSWHNCSTRFQP